MGADVKLQIVTIGASGLVILLATPFLLTALPSLSAGMIRLLFMIPPVSVAAYIFVFNFLRDTGGELPSIGASIFAIVQAGFAAGIFMSLFSGGMLLIVRWVSRWI